MKFITFTGNKGSAFLHGLSIGLVVCAFLFNQYWAEGHRVLVNRGDESLANFQQRFGEGQSTYTKAQQNVIAAHIQQQQRQHQSITKTTESYVQGTRGLLLGIFAINVLGILSIVTGAKGKQPATSKGSNSKAEPQES